MQKECFANGNLFGILPICYCSLQEKKLLCKCHVHTCGVKNSVVPSVYEGVLQKYNRVPEVHAPLVIFKEEKKTT